MKWENEQMKEVLENVWRGCLLSENATRWSRPTKDWRTIKAVQLRDEW